MTKPTDSPAAKLPMPRGFKLFIALAVLMVVGAAISLFDKSEFYADVFIEISVFCVFLAGFFTNTRTLQFAYLGRANIYVIVCLGAFSTVFLHEDESGCGRAADHPDHILMPESCADHHLPPDRPRILLYLPTPAPSTPRCSSCSCYWGICQAAMYSPARSRTRSSP